MIFYTIKRNLWIPFLIILWGAFAGCSGSGVVPAPQTAGPTLILVSFDGFRWDYLDRYETPNFDKLIAQGVRAEGLIPPFPSKTFPSHYSMATGLYPAHHGIVANTMYDPVFDASFSLGNREAVEDARWWEGEPIWVTVEKNELMAATYFWPGTETDVQGIRPTYWKVYNSRIPNEDRVAEALRWMDLAAPPNLITLYFSDLDNAGHDDGPDAPEVGVAIQRVDAILGLLLDGLTAKGRLDQVNIILVSDHGMTPLSPERVVLLDDYINLDDVDVVNWSPVLDLWPKEGKLEQVYTALQSAHPALKVYKKDEIPERFHYRDHRRIAPLVGIMDLGWTSASRSYFERRGVSGGTHGYDNQESDMHGIFIAHGPAFKQGITVPAFENIHLYELMASILNIPPAPNDGNPDALRSIRKLDN